jgi:hypothetical protein
VNETLSRVLERQTDSYVNYDRLQSIDMLLQKFMTDVLMSVGLHFQVKKITLQVKIDFFLN